MGMESTVGNVGGTINLETADGLGNHVASSISGCCRSFFFFNRILRSEKENAAQKGRRC